MVRVQHRWGLPLIGVVLLWGSSADALFGRKSRGKEEAVLPAPAAAGAGLAVAAPQVSAPRKPHMVIRGKEAEQSLVKLATARQLREEELRVIQRLLNEKLAELDRLNARLGEQFDIAADRNYQYDKESNAIFELVPLGEGAADGFDRKPHRTLPDEETATAFLKQVGAKNITSGEIQYLRLLFREKEIEVSRVYETLEKEFSVLRDKHYEYEPAEKTLYEIVPRQTDGTNGAVPRD